MGWGSSFRRPSYRHHRGYPPSPHRYGYHPTTSHFGDDLSDDDDEDWGTGYGDYEADDSYGTSFARHRGYTTDYDDDDDEGYYGDGFDDDDEDDDWDEWGQHGMSDPYSSGYGTHHMGHTY